jgi:CubicO group peptidase (beta-lactamase class C family)
VSPLILGCVLERALARHPSAHNLSGYLTQRIWQPMGAEYDALWNLDRQEGGMEKTESGLTVRAIDLAKFGMLYLDGGRWGSQQLVPAAWVGASTTVEGDPRGPNIWNDGFHKHLWWGRKEPAQTRPDFYANGHFGQRLYVSPQRNLVLLRMGDANSGVDWADFLAAVAGAFGRQANAAGAARP